MGTENVVGSDLKPQAFPDRKWLGALEPPKTEADLRGEPLRDNFFKEVGRTSRATGGKNEIVNSEHRAPASHSELCLQEASQPGHSQQCWPEE